MSSQQQRQEAEIQAFKAKLMAFNKECECLKKEEAALKMQRDKLIVSEMEQSLDWKIHKVDCLEEKTPLSDMDDEATRIPKSGYAQAQDPLVKINIGEEGEDRPTFVSQMLPHEVSNRLIALLKEYKDCFAWEYGHMPGLDKNLVEHRLPTKSNFKPHKQPPRRFAPNVLPYIKKEIERLLKAGFIRTTRYRWCFSRWSFFTS